MLRRSRIVRGTCERGVRVLLLLMCVWRIRRVSVRRHTQKSAILSALCWAQQCTRKLHLNIQQQQQQQQVAPASQVRADKRRPDGPRSPQRIARGEISRIAELVLFGFCVRVCVFVFCVFLMFVLFVYTREATPETFHQCCCFVLHAISLNTRGVAWRESESRRINLQRKAINCPSVDNNTELILCSLRSPMHVIRMWQHIDRPFGVFSRADTELITM